MRLFADFLLFVRYRVLSKIFARALQLHPREASLWIHAAAWEFEEQRNVAAARSLLQRGLRLNGKSAVMWREYFKMEVLFVTRLVERRKVLGLDKDEEDEAKAKGKKDAKFEGAIEVPELDEEGEEEGEDGKPLRSKRMKKELEAEAARDQEGLKDLLSGSIPLVVLRFAVEETGRDADFVLSLYDLCSAAGESPLRDSLRRAVLDAADACREGHPGCAVKRACEALEKGGNAVGGSKGGANAVAKGVREACEVFARYAKKGKGAVREAECVFWREVAGAAKGGELEGQAEEKVVAAAEAAVEEGCATEATEEELVDALARRGGGGKKRKVEGGGGQGLAERALEAARRFPKSVRLWTGAIKHAAGGESKMGAGKAVALVERLVGMMDEALVSVGSGEEAQSLWVDRVKLEMGRGGGVEGAMGVLVRCIGGSKGRSGCIPAVVQGFVDAAASEGGAEGIRRAGKAALGRPLPQEVRSGLLWKLADEELGGRAGGGVDRARIYLEAWANGAGARKDPGGWLRWAEEEERAGHHKRAQDVRWRAQRTLEEPGAFVELQAVAGK